MTKSARSSSQTPLILPIVRVYHYSVLLMRENGNNFQFKISCVMPGITKLEHSSSNSCKWSSGSSLITLEKGRCRTMAIKPRSSSYLDEEDHNGLENSPLRVESCGKDGCSIGSVGKGRRKENKKDTRTTESEDNVAAVPWQRRQKACWYFVTSRINPQAHGYRCSFHLRVF